jgi:hypothetical protein
MFAGRDSLPTAAKDVDAVFMRPGDLSRVIRLFFYQEVVAMTMRALRRDFDIPLKEYD